MAARPGWRRVEKPEFGYAVSVPYGWAERPPDPANSPLETARFADPEDPRHSLIVFRGRPRPGVTALRAAEATEPVLRAAGFDGFALSAEDIAGRDGARLECARHDAGRTWAVREYFVVHDDVRFVLGCGSAVPDEDDRLFAAIAGGFEILTAGATG